MATTTCLPPNRHVFPPRPLSPTDTLTNIQAYLDASATQPQLHPDCIFTERVGPTAGGGGIVLHQLRRLEAGLRGVWMGVVPGLEFGSLGLDVGGEKEGLAPVPARRNIREQVDEEELPEGDDSRLDAAIAQMQGVTEAPENSRRGTRGLDTLDEDEDEDNNNVGGVEDADGNDEYIGNYQEQLSGQGVGTLVGDLGGRSNAVRNRTKVPEVRSTVPSSSAKRKEREGDGSGGRGSGGSAVEHGTLSKDEKRALKKARHREDKSQRAERRGQTKEQRPGGMDLLDGLVDIDVVDDGGDGEEAASPVERKLLSEHGVRRKAARRDRKVAKE